jgi:hypothetical protein
LNADAELVKFITGEWMRARDGKLQNDQRYVKGYQDAMEVLLRRLGLA